MSPQCWRCGSQSRHLFSAYVKGGKVETYRRLGIAPDGGTAQIMTVAEAAAETRAAIADAYELVKTLPGEHYQPISDALTAVISAIHNEALSRLLATVLSFATAPSYDSVLILPNEWVQDLGEETPDALV